MLWARKSPKNTLPKQTPLGLKGIMDRFCKAAASLRLYSVSRLAMPLLSDKEGHLLLPIEAACPFEDLSLGSLSNSYALQLTKARTG